MSIDFAALIVKKQREEGTRTSTPGVTTAADSENGWCKRGSTSLGLKNSSSY
jgi:hypothetical protein